MNENKNQKIIKTILSLMISFLLIFIVAMFARAASNTILPENSSITIFINDYLDMMMQSVDKMAVKMKIKRNSVSEYQVNLITQSISDYVGYSMYQTSDSLKDFNPNNTATKAQLDKYKNNYYKMTVENPYLRGMTVFNTEGKMLLNLYLSRNKSWPLELQDTLINEIKTKGSLVLNATNENAFYIMEYIKNPYGEIIVTTRNDYAYVSDIAMYYQVADKRLYVSDSRNSVYNVRESVGENNIEKVSSVINRYAYYKKQPSFIVNDSLSVSMIGKEYPNYFELIVLAITALLILLCQLVIKGVIEFFKYIMQFKSNKDYVESVKGSDELLNKNIVNVELPKSNTLEEMPPMIQKVQYKIPEEYLKKEENETEKEDKFNIGKDILNIVSTIKEEINECKNRFAITKEDLKDKEEVKESIEENTESSNENNIDYDDIEMAFANINKDLEEEHAKAIEYAFAGIEDEEEIQNAIEEYAEEEDSEENSIEEENIVSDDNTSEEEISYAEDEIDDEEIVEDINSEDEEVEAEEEYMSISDEQLSTDKEDYNTSLQNDFITKALSLDNGSIIREAEENNSEYRKIDNNEVINKNIKNNLLSKNKEEDTAKNLFKKNDGYMKSDSTDISKDILNSYNKALDNIKTKKENEAEIAEENNNTPKEEKSASSVRTDDVFAAFDKMLSSIISKAEEDAKRNITKK